MRVGDVMTSDVMTVSPETPFKEIVGSSTTMSAACPWVDEAREVAAILEEGHRRAREIVGAHRAEFDALARELLDKETLERTDLEAVLGGGAVSSLAATAAPVSPIQGSGTRASCVPYRRGQLEPEES